jgi:hypothetical protein
MVAPTDTPAGFAIDCGAGDIKNSPRPIDPRDRIFFDPDRHPLAGAVTSSFPPEMADRSRRTKMALITPLAGIDFSGIDRQKFIAVCYFLK